MEIQKYDKIPEGAKNAKIWFNGELINWDDATIHMATHIVNYGVGVFEGIRVYDTEEGVIIWHLDAHLERLMNSMKYAGIKAPYSLDELKEACKLVVRESKATSGYIRPQVQFGLSKLSLGAVDVVDTSILYWPLGKYRDVDGLKVVSSEIQRLSPQAGNIKAKIVGFYTNSHFNHEFAKSKGMDEAIMFDVEGNVAEASSSNVFLVKDGVLKTPKLGHILEGITRHSVLELAKDLGIETEEATLTSDDLRNADELFLTGTAAEIEPIIEYDGKEISNGKMGEVTTKIKGHFDLAKKGKIEKFEKWYTVVGGN